MNVRCRAAVDYLVIGYGNTLRTDDGVGYRVAEIVESWQLENVQAIACHQLTPELAEIIAQAKTVIFVDAQAVTSPNSTNVQVMQLNTDANATSMGHYADPRSLLAFAQSLYSRTPIAFQILIPVIDFTFGETLSMATHNHLLTALEKIKEIVGVSDN